MAVTGERAAALRCALRSGHFRDAMILAVYPARLQAYRLRGQLGLRPPAAQLPVIPAPKPLAESLDSQEVVARAGRRFRWEPVPPACADGPRGAGARRLVWPDGQPVWGDLQDIHAWHRLYWLLESPAELVIAPLARWLAATPDPIASHPYATSERIRVMAEFLARSGRTLPTSLRDASIARLETDAEWLGRHVEVHLGVHNHLANNARALCAAAYLLEELPESKRWLSLARELWDGVWPRLLLDDGMLAEQSTHYHVLLTRTLLEYLADAMTAGRVLSPGFLERARGMCDLTNLLLRRDGTLPLFGDVTPDMPTAWLRGLTNACADAGLLSRRVRDRQSGYAGGACGMAGGLFSPVKSSPSAGTEWEVCVYPAGGFLWVANRNSGLELAAHGDPRLTSGVHGDAGCGTFELWHDGFPVVVDAGMPTYEPGHLRNSFRGVHGQNVVSVDGLSPVVLQDEVAALPGWYVAQTESGSWSVSTDSATFRWFGFGRGHSGLVWERRWQWSPHSVTVTDRLGGCRGSCNLGASLHLGMPGWRSPAPSVFECSRCRLSIDAPDGLRVELVPMLISSDYGVTREGQGIRVRGRVLLPSIWSWHFELEDGS